LGGRSLGFGLVGVPETVLFPLAWYVLPTFHTKLVLSFSLTLRFLVQDGLPGDSWVAVVCFFERKCEPPRVHLRGSLCFRFANMYGRSARHERRNYKQQPRSLDANKRQIG
jgi:hypothetical protein